MSLKKKFTSENEKKDRLFFHDLINHTHGLLLYLKNKKQIGESEKDSLITEIKSLQSLIKDHYQLEHKNLQETFDWTPLPVAFSTIKSLAGIYLKDSHVKIFFPQEFSYQVYYPGLYRIMNNLIKNMAEAEAAEVEIKCFIVDETLIIETRNTFKKPDKKTQGSGLLSIKENALRFTSFIENDLWVNKITLLLTKEESPKKAA